jgi:hypothetical protein
VRSQAAANVTGASVEVRRPEVHARGRSAIAELGSGAEH